jgi:hypothetical protein
MNQGKALSGPFGFFGFKSHSLQSEDCDKRSLVSLLFTAITAINININILIIAMTKHFFALD